MPIELMKNVMMNFLENSLKKNFSAQQIFWNKLKEAAEINDQLNEEENDDEDDDFLNSNLLPITFKWDNNFWQTKYNVSVIRKSELDKTCDLIIYFLYSFKIGIWDIDEDELCNYVQTEFNPYINPKFKRLFEKEGNHYDTQNYTLVALLVFVENTYLRLQEKEVTFQNEVQTYNIDNQMVSSKSMIEIENLKLKMATEQLSQFSYDNLKICFVKEIDNTIKKIQQYYFDNFQMQNNNEIHKTFGNFAIHFAIFAEYKKQDLIEYLEFSKNNILNDSFPHYE